ncbi:MAG TPA: hypothetical protein VHD87_14835 [Acidimicrobiales bacterium]|nr:hypothetical protein [Acidimicrobiales bacterium]
MGHVDDKLRCALTPSGCERLAVEALGLCVFEGDPRRKGIVQSHVRVLTACAEHDGECRRLFDDWLREIRERSAEEIWVGSIQEFADVDAAVAYFREAMDEYTKWAAGGTGRGFGFERFGAVDPADAMVRDVGPGESFQP